nr:uncharacterized protein CFP56_21791 [Quercus suber]
MLKVKKTFHLQEQHCPTRSVTPSGPSTVHRIYARSVIVLLVVALWLYRGWAIPLPDPGIAVTMCIAILSTAHPDYPYILLSNRDEFVKRPTAQAQWWDLPDEHVLGGRDLQRAERGTWLGVTRQGRIAVLTNFREEGVDVEKGKSRGGIVNSYLTAPTRSAETPEEFVNRLIRDTGIHNVGGFSLLFGQLRPGHDHTFPGLSIVSNRTSSAQDLTKIAKSRGETHGLSNGHYGDLTWPKVVHGEECLRQAIKTDLEHNEGEAEFIESLFGILSIDTLPKPQHGENWQTYIRQLRNSIFIPNFGGEPVKNTAADKIASAKDDSTIDLVQDTVVFSEGVYGTQKQTVILVNRSGRLTFVERTLSDHLGEPLASDEMEKRFEFDIEGWND